MSLMNRISYFNFFLIIIYPNPNIIEPKMASHWEEFYSTHLPPTDFEDNRTLLKEFVARHNKLNHNIVLVTVSAGI